MEVSRAVQLWLEYHKSNSRDNTRRAHEAIFDKFCREFEGRKLDELASDEVLCFLNQVKEGRKPQTRRTRYAHFSAFFNFMKHNIDHRLQNPCDTPIMKKLFKAIPLGHWDIIEKEAVDEIIFRTKKLGNRLILELVARGGAGISGY
jgi:integrase/recombinase XerD